ncbi:MAG: response regulator [Candidatus Electrothrix sp. GW3-4]|uniref:hybrid sensor histidine kinase/response regulator n=1 Tax=Candidatus Electrothrix sp. GW3-4 TaxID=3126740 RepID=UPI0030CC86B9
MDAAKIMIVEDNTTVAEDCRECLEQSGYQVTSIASSGEDAIAQASIEQPDAVLMDIKLRGEMDGIEAAAQIHSCLAIPVIFLSAYSDDNLLHRAKETGSFGYLIKPFHERELFAMLEMTLYKARAEKERQQLEDKLHEIKKVEAIGRLAGGVAHDFNNMLHVIMGYTQCAMDKVDPDGSVYRNLQEVLKTVDLSAELVKQLLTFARKQIIEPRVLDLNHNAQRSISMLRRIIGEDIDLVWQPAQDLWPVEMDPTQIDQILANLCVNSRDAIVGGGRITVETGMMSFDQQYCAVHPDALEGDFVQLSVSDNGHGMVKEILANIFEPFFTTKEHGKGTGLGLATVYGIVKQNNGFIAVDSKPGQGTTFNIYLPRYIAETVELSVDKPPMNTGLKGNETILLVEDEPNILQMTAAMLREQGYTVLPTILPGKALRVARAHAGKIDLVLTDVIMPEMNGQKLVKVLMSICPNIKYLYMSGYSADVMAHSGVLIESSNQCLQKPFSKKQLVVKIRQVLDNNKHNNNHDTEQEGLEEVPSMQTKDKQER